MASQNRASAVEQIKTLVVDPNDIVTALERARDGERDRTLRVPAPFESESRAELRADGREESGSSAIYLSPELFVENYRGDDPERTNLRAPTREGSRRVARRDHGDDVDEETVEKYHARETEVWEDCVRGSLLEEVRVAHDPGSGDEEWVDVRYED